MLLALSGLCQDEMPSPEIIRYDGRSALFPASWTGGKTKAFATAADPALFTSDSSLLADEMGKYPRSVLKENISHVYIVEKLTFNRQRFTGTNSTDDIYIAQLDNPELGKTFHHEFSSILLRKYGSDELERKWRALSPGIRGGNSASAVKAGLYSTGYDSALLVKGYLSPYSLSNWENDFNMYAENLFGGGPEFWRIVDRYPRVRSKLDLMLDFYIRIWGGYSEKFFRGLAN